MPFDVASRALQPTMHTVRSATSHRQEWPSIMFDQTQVEKSQRDFGMVGLSLPALTG